MYYNDTRYLNSYNDTRCLNSYNAVSYTHLDVYKRQHIPRIILVFRKYDFNIGIIQCHW